MYLYIWPWSKPPMQGFTCKRGKIYLVYNDGFFSISGFGNVLPYEWRVGPLCTIFLSNGLFCTLLDPFCHHLVSIWAPVGKAWFMKTCVSCRRNTVLWLPSWYTIRLFRDCFQSTAFCELFFKNFHPWWRSCELRGVPMRPKYAPKGPPKGEFAHSKMVQGATNFVELPRKAKQCPHLVEKPVPKAIQTNQHWETFWGLRERPSRGPGTHAPWLGHAHAPYVLVELLALRPEAFILIALW